SKKHYFIPTIEQHYVTETSEPNVQSLTHFDVLELLTDGDNQNIRFQSYSLKELNIALQTQVGSGEALAPLVKHIKEWRSKHFRIALVVGAEVRAERLHKMLQDLDCEAQVFLEGFPAWFKRGERAPLGIVLGSISAGVSIPDERLVLVAEHELFKKRSFRKKKKQSVYTLKQLLQSLGELHEEDLVVHDDYGIGKYHGLKNLTIEGLTGDFLHVEYADSTLYVPVQQIAKIQKYNGPDGSAPTLDKLSSNRWKKTKRKVRDSVVSLAGDLVKLYASRSVVNGWSFEPMGAADEDFADGFPYNETVDQLNAITDTLSDMAKPIPMDRLICGDVGFGKTEVAMRAAFKCVQHGRQVAVLVPTTILVEQHRDNFASRFADSKVKVAAVSRFYAPKENKKTIEALAQGDIDIVIGTHALLANSVSFADLGLVIIDEEHRFGVAQKEKLKRLKLNVDVLTLTATPIPRTLHMSLLGLRDVSLISTPPTDRKVVRTYVATRDDILVRDTILREIKRNGQVFFVHNRVKTIATVTDVLHELVPEARFAYAHGQMSEKQLEPIMKAFVDKEIDVLVATSIIESGLDIPNANTLIVDRSDTFGLAQLYQLRGRVGRGIRQAYAYFLIPNLKKLTGEAQKRLQALQSLDDLGQGFHLAVRDLEIRGAGNLLGKEQSGSVLAVGFELYMKIVKEAVLHLKGETADISDKIDPEVKLAVQAYIPEFYVPDVSERLIMYQRLAAIVTSDEADLLLDEMHDRCGPPPQETMTLLEVMRLRGLLRQ
ncbi:MAG: transcription-repair coupling factor, partial [Bdellovibrionales bacterium]|nr:transcription-repair coupling factor [Bdellovibrionales bacterium]